MNMQFNRLFSFFFLQLLLPAATRVTYNCSSNEACGCSKNDVRLSRIIDGETVATDSWGWMVSLRIGKRHTCGGALVSSTLVVTAAHCIGKHGPSVYTVQAGTTVLSIGGQHRSVSAVDRPTHYNPDGLIHDIAIVRLSSPLNMSDPSVSVICLPSNRSKDYPPIDSLAVAIGWGVIRSGENTIMDVLQQVALRTIPRSVPNCRVVVNNDQVQMCAGIIGESKDTCQGDSGGPLMGYFKNRWELIGITSYGYLCGSRDYPGVYTRVTYYHEWISCFLNNSTCSLDTVLFRENRYSHASSIIERHALLLCFCLMVILLLQCCH